MKKKEIKKDPKKLDLACGNNLQPGFTGVDLVKDGTQADIEWNLLKFPWPFKDNSIKEEINTIGFLFLLLIIFCYFVNDYFNFVIHSNLISGGKKNNFQFFVFYSIIFAGTNEKSCWLFTNFQF